MALLARNDGVLSEQWKMREVVVVGNLLAPGALVVTLQAVLAELALMRVVFLVACDAGCPELVLVEVARVTGLALQGRMGAAEREFGLRMVEGTDL